MLDLCLLDHRGAPESIAGGRLVAVCTTQLAPVVLGQQNQKNTKKKKKLPAVRIELTTFRSFKLMKEEYFIYCEVRLSDPEDE